MSEQHAYLIFGAKYKEVKQTCPFLDALIEDNEIEHFKNYPSNSPEDCYVGLVILDEDSIETEYSISCEIASAIRNFESLTDYKNGAVMLVQDKT